MRPAAPQSLRQLIDAMAARLDAAGIGPGNGLGQGTLSTLDEAAWLTLWKLGLPLDTDLDDPAAPAPSPAQVQAVEALLDERIRRRVPAAYLTGEAWLCGLPFTVDERVIIPRSFIAELMADATLDSFLGEHTRRALDLCTGNGSLAVICALTYPELAVDAADISPEALAVARLNVDRHAVQGRVQLLQSDGLAACEGPYDLILCNPPYVNAQSMAALPAEFRAEPALALAGGEDGMDFVRRLLKDVAARMNPQAVLVLEIGHEREHFERAFPHLQPLWLETSAGHDQVLLLTREQLA